MPVFFDKILHELHHDYSDQALFDQLVSGICYVYRNMLRLSPPTGKVMAGPVFNPGAHPTTGCEPNSRAICEIQMKPVQNLSGDYSWGGVLHEELAREARWNWKLRLRAVFRDPMKWKYFRFTVFAIPDVHSSISSVSIVEVDLAIAPTRHGPCDALIRLGHSTNRIFHSRGTFPSGI